MFNLFLTIIGDMLMYLRFTRVMEFAAITVVLMLFSSPSLVFGTVGAGTKLGILDFVLCKKKVGAGES